MKFRFALALFAATMLISTGCAVSPDSEKAEGIGPVNNVSPADLQQQQDQVIRQLAY